MSESIQKTLFSLVVLCFSGAMVVYLPLGSSEYYEVHKSWTTKQCVKMITYTSENPEGVESKCPETLPEKYHNIWVK